MNAIEKLLTIASNEVGYLEKASAKSLYDKTANAGSATISPAPAPPPVAGCTLCAPWALTFLKRLSSVPALTTGTWWKSSTMKI